MHYLRSPLARGRGVYALCFVLAAVALYSVLRAFEYGPQLSDVQDFAQRTFADHPIEYLARKSLAEWEGMVEHQSNDLITAIEEYRRRYRRNPPPGFDKWFAYARQHGSLIIDEFDDIYEMLEQFWGASPTVLRKAVNYVTDDQPDAIGYITLKDGHVTKNKTGWIHDGFFGLLEPVQDQLPDMRMMVSGADEPIVLRSEADPGISDSGAVKSRSRNALTWDDIQKPCSFPRNWHHPEKPEWRAKIEEVSPPLLMDLPFVTNKYDEMNLCKHPEYDKMHDLGRSCQDDKTQLYDGLIPVFSQAAPSTYSDIYFPTSQYWGEGQLPQHDTIAWEDKKNALYWKGSTTGGWALESNNFHYFLRHRFVEFVQGLSNPTYKLLKQSRLGFWTKTSTQQLPEDSYNVHFSAIIQCKPEAVCKKEAAYFKVGAYGPKNESSGYRFIMDIDGNTFANRFYRSLSSRSVIIKQTGFQEWHDERLFPWVHYVPLSISNEELPEIMRYMSETEPGQKLAQEIAERTRGWTARVLRKVDASIFTYRLVLEYARLLRDDRDEISAIRPDQ